MSLQEIVDYPEELLPDEGEALVDPKCDNTPKAIGRATVRSAAAMWERRPAPVKSEPGTPESSAPINTTLAI